MLAEQNIFWHCNVIGLLQAFKISCFRSPISAKTRRALQYGTLAHKKKRKPLLVYQLRIVDLLFLRHFLFVLNMTLHLEIILYNSLLSFFTRAGRQRVINSAACLFFFF